MRKSVLASKAWMCLALCFATIGALAPAARGVTDEEVGKAIQKLKEYLYSKQNGDGGWEDAAGDEHTFGRNAGGTSAIATLALLTSGESMQNPKIQSALKFLKGVDMKGTYAVSMRAHVYSHLPDEFHELLKKDASWLLTTQQMHKLGLFDYSQGYVERVDRSVTQYGMLGLWEYSKRGGVVGKGVWETLLSHFVKNPTPDGGWAYDLGKDATESMTVAGLTALYVAQQELYRKNKSPNKELAAALDKGLQWIDKRFNGGDTMYSLYGLERVALASGFRTYNKRDWYQAGAGKIVPTAMANPGGFGGHGGGIPNTAFALMFLARGRVPVWINKIQITGAHWNERPNDLYYLNHHLSSLREGEVNWQVVNLDSSPEDWLTAPLAYMASDEELKFTDEQKKNIKRYLDQGGLLFCNPDNGSTYFTSAIKKLGEELYPQYTWRKLEDAHPIYNGLFQTKVTPVLGLSNGARELILIAGADVGYVWQSDDNRTGPIWELGTNLFAMATNKGVLENRLVPPFEARGKREVTGGVEVGRAKYEGNWNVEPAAWPLVGNPLFNSTGLNVTTKDIELAEIGNSTLKLIHLAGTNGYALKDPEREAIKAYVEKGGTILVETVGGLGDFAKEITKQLNGVLKNPTAIPLAESDPVISGQGLTGGFNCSRVAWRWRTVQTMAVSPRPRLAAVLQDDRPAVIISHEDLSLGMMGVRHWHIIGYSEKSAQRLATNILLHANKGK